MRTGVGEDNLICVVLDALDPSRDDLQGVHVFPKPLLCHQEGQEDTHEANVDQVLIADKNTIRCEVENGPEAVAKWMQKVHEQVENCDTAARGDETASESDHSLLRPEAEELVGATRDLNAGPITHAKALD